MVCRLGTEITLLELSAIYLISVTALYPRQLTPRSAEEVAVYSVYDLNTSMPMPPAGVITVMQISLSFRMELSAKHVIVVSAAKKFVRSSTIVASIGRSVTYHMDISELFPS